MTPIDIPEDGPLGKTTTPESAISESLSPAPLPGLPYSIDHLTKVLKKIAEIATGFREKYPGLASPPDEFLAAVLPDLEAALGDPLYAERVALRAWAGILDNEAGYNPHHGGLA